MKIKIYALIASSVLFWMLGKDLFAAEPMESMLDCKSPNVVYAENDVALNVQPSSEQHMYWIKNIYSRDIMIDRVENRKGELAGWESQLMPGHESAIAISKGPFKLFCAEINPGDDPSLNCEKSVKICEFKKVAFSKHNIGTYWVEENKTWEELLAAIHERGIVLKN